MKRYIHSAVDNKWSKEYSIRDVFPWDLDDFSEMSDDELIEVVEDSGFVFVPTLKEACDILHDENDNLEDVMYQLDIGWGNGAGILPLYAMGDWVDQQAIYKEYIRTFHPDEIDDE